MKMHWILAAILSVAVVGCSSNRHGSSCSSCSSCCKMMNKQDAGMMVTMDQVPAPVKATILKETAGYTLGDVEQEGKKDKATYSADYMVGSDKYELKVAADGTLLSKKLDNKKDEKMEKGAAK